MKLSILAGLLITGFFVGDQLLAQSVTVRDIDSLKSAYQKADSDSLRSILLNYLAQAHQNPDSVIYYSEKLLSSSHGQSVVWEYRAYQKLGQAYRFKGELGLAIQYLFKALEISDQLEPRDKAKIYITLGDVYALSGDFDKSSEYQRLAIEIFKRSNTRVDSIYLIPTLNNLGDKFLSKGQYDSAQKYFLEALPIAHALNREYFLAILKGNIGLVNAGLGMDQDAERDILEAVAYLSKIEEFYSVSVYLSYMSDIYLKRGKIEKAIHYAAQSLLIAEQDHLKEQIRDASLKLYELHKNIGDHEKSLNYHENYVLFKDSINDLETVKKMANLRTEYEVGQKQVEVDLLTAEKKTQKVIMVAIAAFALVLFILAIVIYQYYQSKARINRVLEQQKAELERLNQTKDKFFSIISHDLRGPVSSFMGISRMIKFLVEHKETEQLLEVADDIDHSVERLSELLDNLLTWAMQQQGHFPNVPEKLYLKEMANDLVSTLANMAKGKNIALTSTIEEDITLWADKNTTMTILRNLVNNALKFTPEGGRVTISADQKGDFAEVSVSDTGVGIPQEKLDKLFKLQDKKSTYGTSGEKGLGLGLQLVYEFIEMNHGSITVESEEGQGTTFRVQLPLFEGVGVGV